MEIFFQMNDYEYEENLTLRNQFMWNRETWGPIHSTVNHTRIETHIVPNFKVNETFQVNLTGVFADNEAVRQIGDWAVPGASFSISM